MPCNYKNSKADTWYQDIITATANLPIAFTYGEKDYTGFSSKYFTLTHKQVKRVGEVETVFFAFQKEELNVLLTVVHYFDFGGTEFTLQFENNGRENSQTIENVRFSLQFTGENPVLKGILGDHGNKYKPYQVDLTKLPVSFRNERGRPTHHTFPYFNLEYGKEGALLAIGWAGTWSADFTYKNEQTQFVAKSTPQMRLQLNAGETIRTALFFVMPYAKRDEHFATNLWRSWFIRYNLPKADAKDNALQPFTTAYFCYDTGIENRDGSISENHTTWKRSMDKLFSEGIYPDFRWFDAGWFVAPDQKPLTSAWEMVGAWELDPTKWPDQTFLQSTEYALQHGMKTFMWFEPERVTDIDNMVANYGYKREWAVEQYPKAATRAYMYNITNNIGEEECYQWTLDKVCKVLKANKVDMFREDHNHNPATAWDILDRRDGENRVGISECKEVAAHYQFLDDIIACTSSYGGCAFTDSCASGGGRNDLETLRRAVPILRSDYDRVTTSLRLSMTYGFPKWVPFHGAYTREKVDQLVVEGVSDCYVWRASYLPILNFDGPFTQNPNFDFDNLRFGLQEWKKVNPYLLKDYYTLTPWIDPKQTDAMVAYCFIDPEMSKGVLFAFRQENCKNTQLKLILPFVKDEEEYVLTDEDTAEKIVVRGGEVVLKMKEARMARLLWIEKK